MASSSPFPTSSSPNKYNVVFIAHDWKGVLFAETFRQLRPELRYALVYQKGLISDPWPHRYITVGNGETKKSAFNIFGNELGQKVWSFSEENFKQAEIFFKQNKIPYSKDETEVSLGFNPSDIKFAGETLEVDEVKLNNSDCFILLSEVITPQLFPRFRDILIPVTLFSFLFPMVKNSGAKNTLFHGGIDFAFTEGDNLHIGSYRNLFADKAVGVLDKIDSVSFDGITQFFIQKKWIESKTYLKQYRAFEAISCDGLGVVGNLSESPQTFVVGGFSARTDNFIFAIAKSLAEGVLTGKRDPQLDLYSTKRFV